MYFSDTELLVIGGYDGSKSLSNVEVYDIDRDLVERLADLPTPR